MGSFSLLQTSHMWNFSEYSEHLGYIGIFLFFITLDQITPLPEEITLLSIGYLSSQHVFNPFIAGAVSFAAFISVDTAYYLLSNSGSRLITSFFQNKKRVPARYEKMLKEHFGPTLITLCFIPRMRMFGPIFAGLMKFPLKRFLLFDAIGLAAFTTLYITLGVLFHNGLGFYFKEMHMVRHIIFGSVLAVAAALIILQIKKNNQAHEKN